MAAEVIRLNRVETNLDVISIPPRQRSGGKRGKVGKRKTMTPFTVDELNRMVAVGKEYISEARGMKEEQLRANMLLCLQIGVNIGLRASDLILLTWDDLYYKDGSFKERVSIIEQKTHKSKDFRLNTACKKVLTEYVSRYGVNISSGWVFYSRNGGHISVDALGDRIKRLAENAGVYRQCATHNLRKTFAEQQLMAHMGDSHFMRDLVDMLNHSSERATLHYIASDTDRVMSYYDDVNLAEGD